MINSHRARGLLAALVLLSVLASCAQTSSAGRRPTAFPSSDAEFQELLHDCMDDAGWPSEKQEDGVYRYSSSEQQLDAFDAANAACIESIGGNLPLARSEGEWRDLYDFYLGSAECLREHDIAVESAPSFSVWAESDYLWSPYASVSPADMTAHQFTELTTACPQTPE